MNEAGRRYRDAEARGDRDDQGIRILECDGRVIEGTKDASNVRLVDRLAACRPRNGMECNFWERIEARCVSAGRETHTITKALEPRAVSVSVSDAPPIAGNG